MLRIFIAILIPDFIKEIINQELKKIKKKLNFKINYVPEENWHFTLIFLGNKNYEEIELIKKSLIDLKNNFYFKNEKKAIIFKKINFAPPNSNFKRMIWLNTDFKTNYFLKKINNFLIQNLKNQNLFILKEEKEFRAHLTLARFQPIYFKNLPLISKDLNVIFNFSKICLMHSILKKPHAEYKEIFNIQF